MVISELRKKTKNELQKDLSGLREKTRVLRFDLKTGKIKNVREIRAARKDIARILTTLKEKNKK